MAWKNGVPLSIGIRGDLVHDTAGDPETDARLNKVLLQASGLFTPRDAFYLDHYFLVDEEPGDVYEAWIQHAFPGRGNLMLRAGQFEQPLAFSPDIQRVSPSGYVVYRMPVGMNDFAFAAPTRGAMLGGTLSKGTRFSMSVGQPRRLFEPPGVRSQPKWGNLFGRVEHQAGAARFGVFGALGKSELEVGKSRFTDHYSHAGLDVEVRSGLWRFYGLWIAGWHTDPAGDGRDGRLDGGFAGVDWQFHPVYLAYLRYDWARSTSSVADRLEQGPAVGLTRVVGKTWRVSVEYAHRQGDRNVFVLSTRGAF